MKMYESRFNWILFLGVQLTMHLHSYIGSDNGLAHIRRQSIVWTNDDMFNDAYMRHSASIS